MFEDIFPDEHPTKGWNRASIMFWSRKPQRRRLSAGDAEIPKGSGLGMLALCAAVASLFSVSFLWFALFVVNLYTPLDGADYGAIMGGVAVTLTVLLYALSARRERRTF